MDKKSLTFTNYKFGLGLHKVISRNSRGQNSFLSPLSIQAALAMTYIGARGRTAKEIGYVLAWKDFGDGDVHQQFQAFFMRVQQPSKYYQLSIVNRIYTEQTFGVTDNFSKETKRCYFAEPVLVNFKEEFEAERVKINTWVAEQTQDKIKDLLVSGVLSADSRMVLINALYFKGEWEIPFLKRETTIQPFKVAPGHTKNVPTMTGTHVYGFVKDSSLQCSAVELPYKGNDLTMVIILPDDDFGLEALVEKLNAEKLDRLLTDVEKEQETLLLSLPKFEITSSFALKHPLSDMGMADAFSTSADFSGISSDRKDLRLSDVLHKSFLQVDEKGTEAATATAAVMIPECEIQSTPFIIDHPFLFAMVDKRFKNLLIFWGQITDPAFRA